jgi:hypothetical protein
LKGAKNMPRYKKVNNEKIKKVSAKTAKQLEYLGNAKLDEKGREILDSRPMVIEGIKRPMSMQDRVHQAIAVHLSKDAASQEHETFEEADDFSVEGEDVPYSGYELCLMEDERFNPPSLNNQEAEAESNKGVSVAGSDNEGLAGNMTNNHGGTEGVQGETGSP